MSVTSEPLSPAVWRAILVLMLVEVFGSLEIGLLYPAMATIAREYGGMGNVTWLISVFSVVQAATVALGARLGDLFGRRRLLVIILLVAGLGSLLSALSSSLALIIVGRGIQGVSAALLPLSFGIIREIVPRDRLAVVIGLLSGMYSASGALGYALGGWMTESYGWHSIFYLTVFLPLITVPLVLRLLPPGSRNDGPRSLDLPGAFLLVPGIVSLLLAITYLRTWAAWEIAAAVLVSAVFTYLWARHESRVAKPLIDVSLLRQRGIAMANTISLLIGMGLSQLPLVVLAMIQQPLWTGVGLGVGATLAGILKLPANLNSALIGPFAGWLANRTSLRFVAVLGTIIGIAGWCVILVWQSPLWLVVLVTILIGANLSFVLAVIPSVVLAIAPPDRSSEAAGMLSLSRGIGTALGAQIAGLLLSVSQVVGPAGVRFPDAHAFQATYIYTTICAVLSLFACMALPRTAARRSEPKSEAAALLQEGAS